MTLKKKCSIEEKQQNDFNRKKNGPEPFSTIWYRIYLKQ